MRFYNKNHVILIKTRIYFDDPTIGISKVDHWLVLYVGRRGSLWLISWYNHTTQWLILCTLWALVQFRCGVLFMGWYFLFIYAYDDGAFWILWLKLLVICLPWLSGGVLWLMHNSFILVILLILHHGVSTFFFNLFYMCLGMVPLCYEHKYI